MSSPLKDGTMGQKKNVECNVSSSKKPINNYTEAQHLDFGGLSANNNLLLV